MVFELMLLALALAMFGLSLLTAIPVSPRINWKWALLAGEFGHWLALLPLGLAALFWSSRGDTPVLSVVGMIVCAAAFVLLLKPVVQARRVARDLPRRLEAAFGRVAMKRPPFSMTQLVQRVPVEVRCVTHDYGPGLALDFYQPPTENTAPCVVVIHGGGWDGGDRRELAHFNTWLASQGVAVAAVDYRLAPQHPWPAQRDDVSAALAWLKTQADALGIDPQRFVLLGRSAGGQIASAVAYTAQDPAIRGVIAFYAPHDMDFAWSVSREDDALNSLNLMRQYLDGPPGESRREIYHTASAQHNIGPVTPPTLLLHGTIDTLVWRRHSERLAAQLSEAGRPHLFIELPWATHAFEYHLAGPGGQLTTFAVEWFLKSVTWL